MAASKAIRDLALDKRADVVNKCVKAKMNGATRSLLLTQRIRSDFCGTSEHAELFTAEVSGLLNNIILRERRPLVEIFLRLRLLVLFPT